MQLTKYPRRPAAVRSLRQSARHALAFLFISLALCLPSVLHAQEKTSENDARLAGWLKRFPEADANRDGVLTMSEADAYRQNTLQKRNGKKLEPLQATLADVSYGPHPRQVLDVFKASSETPTPVLIFFHGGGFVAGDKKLGASHPLSRQCADSGISVVSANYRYVKQGPDGAPAQPFPGPMEDGVRVVQFVRANAAEWNIDPKRVALTGGSAGAVLSLWIALNEEQAKPESDDPIARQSSRVSCVVGFSGPTSLDPKVILAHVGGSPQIHPSLLPFYGVEKIEELEQPEKRKLIENASVINHITADDPPLYLKYGGTVAGAPLPADAPSGKSIHHAMFGKMLKDKCDELGVHCVLSCGDVHADIDEITFLKQVFGMNP